MTMTNNSQTSPTQNASKAPDLSNAVEALMNRMNSLSDVYKAETEALRRADTHEFAMIQNLKMEEAQHYERDMRALMQHNKALSSLDPTLKEKLKVLQEEFTSLVKDNALALSRMQDTTKRLSGLILKANRRAIHNETAVNYGKSGKLIEEGRKNISMGRVSKKA